MFQLWKYLNAIEKCIWLANCESTSIHRTSIHRTSIHRRRFIAASIHRYVNSSQRQFIARWFIARQFIACCDFFRHIYSIFQHYFFLLFSTFFLFFEQFLLIFFQHFFWEHFFLFFNTIGTAFIEEQNNKH